MSDYLVRGELEDLDPEVFELTEYEAERQYRRLILIPSESTAPAAVRQALATSFNNIYAEGYPHSVTRRLTEQEILDYAPRLAHYRRYSDPRYYKGVEYADILEALARRRCADLFAANGLTPDQLHVNVQPLSGAPANNAVYHALVEPGETIMGMDLMQGGHLTHGSPVNRSGKLYRSVHYGVDPDSERIDYEQVERLASEHEPKIIIAGYSSYPWEVDWSRFKEIAEAVGAYLLADIAHIAGPIAAGVLGSPVGHADVITFTTHKSLCGPRGAVVITTSHKLANRIDRAVFPGEQGGPHMNTIAAQAVAFKLARSDSFRKLQAAVLANCAALTEAIEGAGMRIPFGGTNTHLTNVDCSSIVGPDGSTLSGDQAARILDVAGIVVNRNTIPGDTSAARPSGIRLGTVWITQRGFGEQECRQLGESIVRLLEACTPYSIAGRTRPLRRAKVDFGTLSETQRQVRDWARELGIDYEPGTHGYPHFQLSDEPALETAYTTLSLTEGPASELIRFVTDARPLDLTDGEAVQTSLHTPSGAAEAVLQRVGQGWELSLNSGDAISIANWLRALSDGYITFDERDLHRKPPGPVVVQVAGGRDELPSASEGEAGASKPWFLGATADQRSPLPAFRWEEPEAEAMKRTALFETHKALGAKIIPFAGWEMPVWYSSVVEEHNATRQAAGLFDVSHMGVYQAEGPRAEAFLDSVVANDVAGLPVGASLYTHLLDPDGTVLDDAMVYHRAEERYLMVVNASNDDKARQWLNGVNDGAVQVDSERSGAVAFGHGCTLRNLRDPAEGDQMRVDIALQGPASRSILVALGCSASTADQLEGLPWAGVMEGEFGGFELILSRTGYTGERVAFELFVHPDRSPALWKALLDVGADDGLKPAGLGARDSLRTEAGLPLYGQEMAGELTLGVGDAGFASYVKTYKSWFVGRSAFMRQEQERTRQVVRFRFDEQRVRMAHYGDQVVDREGTPIGTVTSCAIDSGRYLTGQAHIDRANGKVGTEIGILLASKADRPVPARVLSRFPKP
jgi:glycine hydroxymethyltransferase